jgi:hypothetical protein
VVLNSWQLWVHYDLLVLAPERVGFTSGDLLMVMVRSQKMGPIVKQVYLQMAEPLGDGGWGLRLVVEYSTLILCCRVDQVYQ